MTYLEQKACDYQNSARITSECVAQCVAVGAIEDAIFQQIEARYYAAAAQAWLCDAMGVQYPGPRL